MTITDHTVSTIAGVIATTLFLLVLMAVVAISVKASPTQQDCPMCVRVTQLEHRVAELEATVQFFEFLQGEVVLVRTEQAKERLIVREFGRYVLMKLDTYERLFKDMGYTVFQDTTTKE